jgi:hypothetical protein
MLFVVWRHVVGYSRNWRFGEIICFKISIITITWGLIAFISSQYLYLSDPRLRIDQLDMITKTTKVVLYPLGQVHAQFPGPKKEEFSKEEGVVEGRRISCPFWVRFRRITKLSVGWRWSVCWCLESVVKASGTTLKKASKKVVETCFCVWCS